MRLKGQYSKRLCFFLAILVLGQEFKSVLTNSALHMKDGLQQRKETNYEDPSSKYSNGTSQEDGLQVKDNTKEGKAIQKHRKRWIHGALFAVSIATSLINLGLDVILKIKGCSFFYPSIKGYTRDYNHRSRDVARRLRLINAEWERVKRLRRWIGHANNQNARIWLKVKRIGDLQGNIVKLLDPDIIKEFNNKEHFLKKMVERGDRRTLGMSYQQLDNMFQQSFSTVKDTAVRLSGITGLLGGGIAAYAFKRYKLAKIQKTLRTSYGSKLYKAGPGARRFFGFSKSSMNLHLKQTSKSVYRASFSGAKYARFMKGAGSVMSVVGIVMDIYSIIKKIHGCRRMRDNARRGVHQARIAQHRARVMQIQLHHYKRALHHRGYLFVKKQLTSNDLRTVLVNIRNMANAASYKARDLKSAAPVMNRFLYQIYRANDAHIAVLQQQLISALGKVTVFLTCYYNKLRMVTYVVNYCQQGHADVQTLFNNANRAFNSNSQFCRTKNGFAYTTLESVKRLIRSHSKKKWFNFDCLLNSKRKKDQACRMKWGGYNINQIVARMRAYGVQPHHVKHYLISCGQQPITPLLEHQICYLRKRCIDEKFVSSFISISQKRILGVECPCHA